MNTINNNSNYHPINYVGIDEFHDITKEDLLYTTLLVMKCSDFHGNPMFDHKTVWAAFDDVDEFDYYLDWLTPEEIVNFRDELNGNILSGLAENNKPLSFFELIADRIGWNHLSSMITDKNRGGICPLAKVKDLQVFIALSSLVTIDRCTLRQICSIAPNDIIEHLTELINSANDDLDDDYVEDSESSQ